MLNGPERAHRQFESHRPQGFTVKGHFVNVGQIAAPGLVMGMAHIVASQNPFACNIAPSRHFSISLQIWPLTREPILLNSEKRIFKTAKLPRQGLFSRIHGNSEATPGGFMVTIQ